MGRCCDTAFTVLLEERFILVQLWGESVNIGGGAMFFPLTRPWYIYSAEVKCAKVRKSRQNKTENSDGVMTPAARRGRQR